MSCAICTQFAYVLNVYGFVLFAVEQRQRVHVWILDAAQIMYTHTHNKSCENARTLCQIYFYCVAHSHRDIATCVSRTKFTIYTSTPHSLHIILNLFFPSVYLFCVAQKFVKTFCARCNDEHAARAYAVVAELRAPDDERVPKQMY